MKDYYQLTFEDILFPNTKHVVHAIKAHPESPCDLFFCPVCGVVVASAVDGEFLAIQYTCKNGHMIDYSQVPYYNENLRRRNTVNYPPLRR